VFGSVNLTDKIAAFARYDWVNPERDAAAPKTNSATRDQYFNLGLSYTPVKNVDLAAVYKRENVDGGLLTTGNGAAVPASLTAANASPAGSGIIGSLNGNGGTYDEFGIFVRYAF